MSRCESEPIPSERIHTACIMSQPSPWCRSCDQSAAGHTSGFHKKTTEAMSACSRKSEPAAAGGFSSIASACESLCSIDRTARMRHICFSVSQQGRTPDTGCDGLDHPHNVPLLLKNPYSYTYKVLKLQVASF